MKNMSLEQARQTLAIHFPYPPETSQEASTWLRNHETESVLLPEENQPEIYMALYVLSCASVEKPGRSNPKREERKRGAKVSRKRTRGR